MCGGRSLVDEEHVIRWTGRDLDLSGGQTRGTLYAVAEFREDFCGPRGLTLAGEKYFECRRRHHSSAGFPLDREAIVRRYPKARLASVAQGFSSQYGGGAGEEGEEAGSVPPGQGVGR